MRAGGYGVARTLFDRPAELVELSELMYSRLFGAGLWVAVACSAFGVLVSALAPGGVAVSGMAVCGGWLAVMTVAALHPETTYRLLRRRPWALLAPGVVLGGGAFAQGPENFQFFPPLAATVAAAGIATPLPVVVAAATVGVAGLAAPKLIDGTGPLAESIAVLVPPVMVWLIVDRIAGFSLRLHQALGTVDAREPSPGLPAPQDAEPFARSPADEGSLVPVAPRTVAEDVKLTARQRQVVLLVCEGCNHAEIAACLGIGAAQVRRHLDRARTRTGSKTTPQLVAWARRTGLAP